MPRPNIRLGQTLVRLADYPRRIADGNGACRHGLDHYGASPDRAAITHLREDDCARPDPTIRANADGLEYAVLRSHNPAFWIPRMLFSSAKDLYSRSDLGS